MASNEQSVTLLRRNKRAQVEALNSLGFNLTEGARAADFPMYIKWGAGLLDVTVAANRKSDNKRFFFTVGEWQALSVTEQDMFLLRGVRVRACGTSFIIAPDTIIDKAWGATNVSIPDIHSFADRQDLYSYYNAYEETRLIVQGFRNSTSGDIAGAPAAEAALAYKAFTLSRDGAEDTSEWCLPTVAHLIVMFRWVNEINAVLSAVWSNDFILKQINYWSCGQWEKNNIYYIEFASCGSIYVSSPVNRFAVRPICLM